MKDHKYGELWEVRKLGHNFTLHKKGGQFIGDIRANKEDAVRAVLCVNACAGMSDEEVGKITKVTELVNDVAPRAASLITTLQAQLTEAAGLLERHCKGCLIEMANDTTQCHLKCDTKNFLIRKEAQ